MCDMTDKSTLRELSSYNDIYAKKIYDAAMAGDKVALAVFKFTGKMLGQAMADVVALIKSRSIYYFWWLSKVRRNVLLEPTARKHLEK
jgi:glucokinase